MRQQITTAFVAKKAENVLQQYANSSYWVGYYGVVKNTQKLHDSKELCTVYSSQYRCMMEILGVKASEIEEALTAVYTPKFNKGQRAGTEYKNRPSTKKAQELRKTIALQKKTIYKGKAANMVTNSVTLSKK